jgi:hypothetical protein
MPRSRLTIVPGDPPADYRLMPPGETSPVS